MPEENRGGTQRTVGLLVAGAGIVGFGVAAYYGGRALSEKSEARRTCPTVDCEADAADANERARRSVNRSLISAAAGTGLIAAGVITYLTAPRSTPVRGTAPRSRTTARVIPEASPTQVGLGVVGSF
jgi:hypothetical protein